jgi:calcineurin-like phosphoesterase family protein
VIDYRAKYLIHGHVHLRTNEDWWHLLKNDERALNAGVDVNGYAPVTLEELIENNARYKQRSEI